MARPDLGSMFARIGFGREPLASHVELNREMLASCDSVTAREATTALLGLDLTAELPSLDIPTLVVGGTADLITPPTESRRLANLIPGARLHLFEGAGHMLMLERTEAFDDLLIDFARDLGVLPAAAGAA
jgi:pimeloyl-ACP methyl ester carboxylesterase